MHIFYQTVIAMMMFHWIWNAYVNPYLVEPLRTIAAQGETLIAMFKKFMDTQW